MLDSMLSGGCEKGLLRREGDSRGGWRPITIVPESCISILFADPAIIVPPQFRLRNGAYYIYQRPTALGQGQSQAGSPHKQVFEVNDSLRARGPTQLSPEVRCCADSLEFTIFCAGYYLRGIITVSAEQPQAFGGVKIAGQSVFARRLLKHSMCAIRERRP